jgi:hypothetical protein
LKKNAGEFSALLCAHAVFALCPFSLRQQSLETHKRKAVESSQTAADLKLHLDKYHAQLKEAQSVVADKSMALQQQSFKYKRIQVGYNLLLKAKLLYFFLFCFL